MPNNDKKTIRKVLLVGYNGANNTGSEARLISVIEDVRSILGDVQITIPTLNEANLRRYITEGNGIIIKPIPSIYFQALKKLVQKNDLILLEEGSCYMDTWTSALLWAFLWVTRCASKAGVPCIAYAVDSGKLSLINSYLVKREASKTDLIIVRSKNAIMEMESIGITAPIKLTADCAFNFKPDQTDKDILSKTWPEADSVVGLSVLDYNLWPVVIRLWGKPENRYRWPYYFSNSKKRRKLSDQLAEGWANQADKLISEYSKDVALICMEELDEHLAYNILDKMQHTDHVRVYSSSKYNASQMTHLLNSLDLLVTSRYHASILSLKSLIPQIAVGHDTRLRGFYNELELLEDYFIDSYSPDLWSLLDAKIDILIKNPDETRELLEKGYTDHLKRSQKNKELLKSFLIEKGFQVQK